MLRVDEGDDSAHGLCLCENLQGEGGLAGGLRAKNLYDAPSGNTPYAKCRIERDGTCGNRLDLKLWTTVAKAHDRTFAEFLLDLLRRTSHNCVALLAIRAGANLPCDGFAACHAESFLLTSVMIQRTRVGA